MTTAGSGSDAGGFEAMARQYFNAWGGALRHAGAPGPTASAGLAGGDAGQGSWQQAIEHWARMMPDAAGTPADEAVHRFREQAGGWYGTMQQVAARFAGQDSSSADVAQAWRSAVEGQGDGLLQWMLHAARGHTQAGAPDLLRVLEGLQRDLGPWLQSPAFGPGREHQARWQALLRAQQEYQTHSSAYVDQIKQALDDAFALFEQRLAEHEQPGNQLTSARAMFDLWIEAAEEAYGKVALSEPFQQVYAALGNAQMRLRAAAQQEIERLGESLGLPTRTEMDAAHRKIAELERLVRRLINAGTAVPAPAREAAPTPAPAKKQPAAAKAPARKRAAGTPPAGRAAAAAPAPAGRRAATPARKAPAAPVRSAARGPARPGKGGA